MRCSQNADLTFWAFPWLKGPCCELWGSMLGSPQHLSLLYFSQGPPCLCPKALLALLWHFCSILPRAFVHAAFSLCSHLPLPNQGPSSGRSQLRQHFFREALWPPEKSGAPVQAPPPLSFLAFQCMSAAHSSLSDCLITICLPCRSFTCAEPYLFCSLLYPQDLATSLGHGGPS